MDLLKTTLLAFLFSTGLHIGTIIAYNWLFLYFNPDDQGKKDFYAATSVTQGVNIGGKVVGGGGVQTNHHKSYLLHVVREYYKTLSKMFFIEFSLIYVFFLYVLNFFPNRERLKVDTAAAFASFKAASQSEQPSGSSKKSGREGKKRVTNTRLRARDRRQKLKGSESDAGSASQSEIDEDVDKKDI